ncbi:MAG: lytic transglycosylase domain-containing protein, partial [Clostridia bacterium]
MSDGSAAPAGGFEAALAAARATGLPPALVQAVEQEESGGNPQAVSSAGAIGLMQLMPGTAAALNVNPWDPAQNLLGGATYLADQLQRFGGNLPE